MSADVFDAAVAKETIAELRRERDAACDAARHLRSALDVAHRRIASLEDSRRIIGRAWASGGAKPSSGNSPVRPVQTSQIEVEVKS